MSYGEIQAKWPDRKVSPSLTSLLEKSAEMWDVPIRQQLWIKPKDTASEVWVYDYVREIWTKYKYPKSPVNASVMGNGLYVFMGKDLYEQKDGYTQDWLKDEGKTEITAIMRMGTLLTGNQVLLKKAFASFSIMPGCRAELWLGRFKMTFTGGGNIDYIYDAPNDTQKASEDTDPLFPVGGTQTARSQCIVRDWSVTPEVKIYGGGCSLSTMGLEIVEV